MFAHPTQATGRFAAPVPAARVRGAAILTGLLAILYPYCAARAEEPPLPLEYQVKAAFLLNFTKFIEWPQTESAEAGSPMDICIVGEDPFGTVLDQMVEGETLQGRKLAVQRVHRPLPGSCRILFVGRSEKDVDGLIASLGPGVLSVSEGTGFLRNGGMIAFVVENRRVRFDINQGNMVKAGLNISSKLLNVARSVLK